MNKVTVSIIVSLIIVIVVLFLGRLVFLSQIEREITQTRSQISRLELDKKALDESAKKLKESSVKMPKNTGKILDPGQEAEAFKAILSCGGKNRFNFQNFEELKVYNIKSTAEDNVSQSSKPALNSSQPLPKFDNQGNAVNMIKDEEDWAGVEILPVKFAFKTTFSGIGSFLSNTKKELPLHGVRNMDLIFDESGIVRGTIVLIFPESERK